MENHMYLSLRDWIVDEADEELDGVAAGEGQVARASLVAHHAPAAQTKHMCVDDKCLRLKVWSLENVKVKGIHEFALGISNQFLTRKRGSGADQENIEGT